MEFFNKDTINLTGVIADEVSFTVNSSSSYLLGVDGHGLDLHCGSSVISGLPDRLMFFNKQCSSIELVNNSGSSVPYSVFYNNSPLYSSFDLLYFLLVFTIGLFLFSVFDFFRRLFMSR
jgi:hypothetical protein